MNRAELRKSYEEVAENIDIEKSRYQQCVARMREANNDAVDSMSVFESIDGEITEIQGYVTTNDNKINTDNTGFMAVKNDLRGQLTAEQRRCEKLLTDAVANLHTQTKSKDIFKSVKKQFAAAAGNDASNDIASDIAEDVKTASETLEGQQKECDTNFRRLENKIAANDDAIAKTTVHLKSLQEDVAQLEQKQAKHIQQLQGLITSTAEYVSPVSAQVELRPLATTSSERWFSQWRRHWQRFYFPIV
jgi:chromosome segregation ATPase